MFAIRKTKEMIIKAIPNNNKILCKAAMRMLALQVYILNYIKAIKKVALPYLVVLSSFSMHLV